MTQSPPETAFTRVLDACAHAVRGETASRRLSAEDARLAAVQGVLPLLADQLETPSIARADVARLLALTSMLADVATWLHAAGIPYCALKGPALSQQLFGTPARRQFTDVDILVAPGDVTRASALLTQHGFQAMRPVTDASQAHFLRAQHEQPFQQRSTGHLLELQWAWAQAHYVVPADVTREIARADVVTCAGVHVAVLAPADLALYLAVHGSKHGWRDLALCCDFAAVAHRFDIDWDQVLNVASKRGLERMLKVASLLAHELFGVSAPLPRDLSASAIARGYIGALEAGKGAESMSAFLQLRERAIDRARIVARSLLTPTPSDLAWVHMPDRWFRMYYALRPVRFALRGANRLTAMLAGSDRRRAG